MQPLALQNAVQPKLLQLCVNCAPASCEFHSQLHRRCESRRAALSREATKSKEQRKEIVDLTAKLRALSLELASVKAASTRTRALNRKLSKKAAAASMQRERMKVHAAEMETVVEHKGGRAHACACATHASHTHTRTRACHPDEPSSLVHART